MLRLSPEFRFYGYRVFCLIWWICCVRKPTCIHPHVGDVSHSNQRACHLSCRFIGLLILYPEDAFLRNVGWPATVCTAYPTTRDSLACAECAYVSNSFSLGQFWCISHTNVNTQSSSYPINGVAEAQIHNSCPQHQVVGNGQQHALAALLPGKGHPYPQEGGWVGLRASMDALKR
jgi:hypothetical protein